MARTAGRKKKLCRTLELAYYVTMPRYVTIRFDPFFTILTYLLLCIHWFRSLRVLVDGIHKEHRLLVLAGLFGTVVFGLLIIYLIRHTRDCRATTGLQFDPKEKPKGSSESGPGLSPKEALLKLHGDGKIDLAEFEKRWDFLD